MCVCVYVCVRQGRLTKEPKWGGALLSRNQSLEEEFERAKAAVEVSATYFGAPTKNCESAGTTNWPVGVPIPMLTLSLFQGTE